MKFRTIRGSGLSMSGKATFLVGGAVRDDLLGLPVAERDWVVVGATPEELEAEGFRRADPEFPVFLHPRTGEEYALARRETKAGPGYRGFEIESGPDVTLEEDLARRDLTINAMARDDEGNIIDPYGGRGDLELGLLRHVTDAFVEDPVRLLRIARFAARLGAYGFRVAHGTHRLMKQMVEGGAVRELRPQRIWREMIRAMAAPQPWRFFEVLDACGALGELLPGLGGTLAGAHGERPPAPMRIALEAASEMSGDPELRLAAFLLLAPESPDTLRARLGLSRRVVGLLQAGRALWPLFRDLDRLPPAEVEQLLRGMGAWRQGERFHELALVLSAQPAAPLGLSGLLRLREAGLSVDTAALRERGLSGAELGQAITGARIGAIEKARH